jgi:predicted nucleic acid-binding protein
VEKIHPLASATVEKVYIDSSVLVSCASTNHPFWPYATNFLGKVQHGNYEGITSTLALMECITGIRGILAHQGIRDTKKWEKAVKDHFDALYKMQNLRFIDGTPADPKTEFDWRLSDVLFESLAILVKYSGKAVEDRQNRKLSKLKHDGLYAPDAIHVVLAKRSGCSRLATFDQDFLESKKEIQPIVLNIHSGW